MGTIRLIGFELTTRDGITYATEGDMFDAAKALMIAEGKVYRNIN